MISELLTRIDAHETEGEEIKKAMAEAGVDAKKLKEIRKAAAKAEAAKKTLAALVGEGIVTAGGDVVGE